MTQPSSAPWHATAEDIAQLGGFAATAVLQIGRDGRLGWANGAARFQLGVGTGPEAALPTLDELRPASLGRPTGRGGEAQPDLADVLQLAAGSGTGPHVSAVATRSGSTLWWEWSAWHEPGVGVVVVAEDVTGARRGDRVQQARQRTLDTLLEGAAAAIAVRSVDGRLVLANDQWRTWFGSGGDEARLSPAETRVAASGSSDVADEQVPGADRMRTVLSVRFPLRDGSGRVAHVATVASDITARRQVEGALADRRRLLDTLRRVSPDVLLVLGEDGRVAEISDAFAVLAETDPGELPRMERHVHPDDVPGLAAWLQDVMAGRDAGRFRHRLRTGSGRPVHLEAIGRPLRDDDGRIVGAVIVSRDVSAAVAVEQELQRAASVAEGASRAKNDFLARISHELLGPLQQVLSAADRLAGPAGDGSQLDGPQLEAVEHIDRAGRHLQSLIDEIVDVAGVGRPGLALSPEPVAVGKLVTEAVGLARPLGDARGVRLSATVAEDGGPWAVADRQRLLQVLLNLLSNAVKYNHPHGTVRVAVSSAGSRVRVAVTDTGVGIAPEHLDRLFDPFDRLGAEASGVEGTGVGLTLTKHLVEQMGGTVEVASAVGAGTVFTVDLAAAPRPSAAADPGGRPPSGRTVRVLHVEDDPASGELVRRLLQRRGGVDLVRAQDGATALDLARRPPHPDLVLLDLGLPDVGGEAVLERLSGDPATAAIPVVVVSADATDSQVSRLRAAGAAAYLTKPVAVGQLLALVDAAAGVAAPGDPGAAATGDPAEGAP